MIQSISVNGETHQIDYNTLANKPTIPEIPSVTSVNQGKVLAVNSSGQWYLDSRVTTLAANVANLLSYYNSLNNTITELNQSVASMQSRLAQLEDDIQNGQSTQPSSVNVNSSKLSVSGTSVNATNGKLTIPGTVSDNKLIL